MQSVASSSMYSALASVNRVINHCAEMNANAAAAQCNSSNSHTAAAVSNQMPSTAAQQQQQQQLNLQFKFTQLMAEAAPRMSAQQLMYHVQQFIAAIAESNQQQQHATALPQLNTNISMIENRYEMHDDSSPEPGQPGADADDLIAVQQFALPPSSHAHTAEPGVTNENRDPAAAQISHMQSPHLHQARSSPLHAAASHNSVQQPLPLRQSSLHQHHHNSNTNSINQTSQSTDAASQHQSNKRQRTENDSTMHQSRACIAILSSSSECNDAAPLPAPQVTAQQSVISAARVSSNAKLKRRKRSASLDVSKLSCYAASSVAPAAVLAEPSESNAQPERAASIDKQQHCVAVASQSIAPKSPIPAAAIAIASPPSSASSSSCASSSPAAASATAWRTAIINGSLRHSNFSTDNESHRREQQLAALGQLIRNKRRLHLQQKQQQKLQQQQQQQHCQRQHRRNQQRCEKTSRFEMRSYQRIELSSHSDESTESEPEIAQPSPVSQIAAECTSSRSLGASSVCSAASQTTAPGSQQIAAGTTQSAAQNAQIISAITAPHSGVIFSSKHGAHASTKWPASWAELDDNVLCCIFSFIADPSSLIGALWTCKSWYKQRKDERCYTHGFLCDYPRELFAVEDRIGALRHWALTVPPKSAKFQIAHISDDSPAFLPLLRHLARRVVRQPNKSTKHADWSGFTGKHSELNQYSYVAAFRGKTLYFLQASWIYWLRPIAPTAAGVYNPLFASGDPEIDAILDAPNELVITEPCSECCCFCAHLPPHIKSQRRATIQAPHGFGHTRLETRFLAIALHKEIRGIMPQFGGLRPQDNTPDRRRIKSQNNKIDSEFVNYRSQFDRQPRLKLEFPGVGFIEGQSHEAPDQPAGSTAAPHCIHS